MSQIIIVTGLSGSGKTHYLASLPKDNTNRDYAISLDELTKYYNKREFPKNKFVKFFISTHSYGNVDSRKINWNKDKYNIHNDFLKWIKTFDGTFYIEGIHFFKPKIIDYDLLVENSEGIISLDFSVIRCVSNRIYRCFAKKYTPTYIKLYNLFRYDLNPIHIVEYFQFKKFKKKMNKRTKGIPMKV